LNQLTPSGCLWPTPRWLNWWSSSGYESPRWLQLWCSSRYVCPQWWSRWLQVDVYGPSMIELVKFKWMWIPLGDCSYDAAVDMCALSCEPADCKWKCIAPRWLNWWSSSGFPRWLQLWCSSR
jgi:hypothetical protein